MIIGDHNLTMFTQEYFLSMIQDSYPEVKLNNANAFVFIGEVEKLQNDRVIYAGFWTLSLNYEQVRNIYLILFNRSIRFPVLAKSIHEDDPYTMIEYIGPAQYWNYEGADMAPMRCAFMGFRFEVDNVPAPPDIPTPPPSYSVDQFWFVVDEGIFSYLAVVSGGDRVRMELTVDTHEDGCQLLDGQFFVSADQEITLNATRHPLCQALGSARNIEVKYPNHYGVRFDFIKYIENAADGIVQIHYRMVKELDNMFYVPGSFHAIGVASTVELNNDILICTVSLADSATWTQIEWTVSNQADFLYSTFSHTFERDKGFTGFNTASARYKETSGSPCSSSVKTVWIKKPATTLVNGTYVYPAPDSSTAFANAANEIVPIPGSIRYELQTVFVIGTDERYNRVGSPLTNCI